MNIKTKAVIASLSIGLVATYAQQPGPNDGKITIEQPNMEARVIAALYHDYTGKRVIVSNAAQAQTISLISPGEMTKEEAAILLEKACLLEGLVFVPSGLNEVKLVPSQDAKIQGLPYITEADLIPPGDAVISYLMKLENISPDDALRAFQSIAGGFKAHGSMTSLPNANALVVTENASLIKTLIQIKETIDIPQSTQQFARIQLENADAETLAGQLNAIVQAQVQQNSQGGGNGAGQNRNQPPGTQNQGNNNANRPVNTAPQGAANSNLIQSGQIQEVNITPIARTNSIFVIGRPIDLLFIKGLIAELDEPIEVKNFYKAQLNYLPVADFLPVLENGIQQIAGNTGNEGGAARGANSQQPSGSTGANGGADLASQTRSEQPVSLLVGKTLLVADNTNNTLIVQGPPRSIEVAKNLIQQMDVPGKQVQITAIFGRYTVSDEEDFGVDFTRVSNGTTGGNTFAAQTGTGFQPNLSPNTLTTPESFVNAVAGLALYGQVTDNIFYYLNALESEGKFKLLSRPTLFTTNNRLATISSGQRIAVPTSTLSNGTGDNSLTQSTNIEFRDVELVLEVVPLVNSDDEVTLSINFTNDNVIGNQTIDGNVIPTIGAEELVTTVKVPNNGMIALGGLITERVQEDTSGIPILSSIPGIGKIFTSTGEETVREELVILIQPRIVSGPTGLADLNRLNAANSSIIGEQGGNLLLPNIGDLSIDKKNLPLYTEPTVNQTPRPAPLPAPARKEEVITSPRDRFKGTRR